MAEEKAKVMKAHEDVGKHLATLNGLIAKATDATREARQLVTDMGKAEQAYGPVALAIVDLALHGKKDEAIAKMNDECRPLLKALSKASSDYAAMAKTRSFTLVQEAASQYELQRKMLIAACLLALVAAVAAGLLVTRAITQPLSQALRMAESAASGDLTLQIDAPGNDEVSQLVSALGRMNKNLGEIVQQVRQSSDSIATGSAQIATGNADLSHRTEQQASSLEETAASMEQLNATVQQNAGNAAEANHLAQGASAVAIRGGAVVNQVVSTMKDINDSSKKIADIISVIDGIAFQTNILALNAAVEAARAGEQGRGFAVVASEVRSLAGRSAEAAKEIKGLISASVERVEQGTALVDQAGTTMAEVVSAIKRVTDLMGEISAASSEQSQGVSQVGEAVTQMDQVTQQNAALVEEMAAAASSLQTQANDLVQTVAVFKLNGQNAPSTHTASKPAVRSHKPGAPAFKGTDRRSVGVAKGAAARAHASAKLSAPTATNPKATTSADGNEEWESF